MRPQLSQWLGLVVGLLLARPAPAIAQPAPTAEPTYSYAQARPRLPGTEGTPELPRDAVQRLVRLPPGTALPVYQVRVRFAVEKDGSVADPQVVNGLGGAIDAAVLDAVRRLPRFEPGQVGGRVVRTAVVLDVWPGGEPAPPTPVLRAEPPPAPDSVEACTLRRGLAERRDGEPVADFLARVLPASFAEAAPPVSYAWHPGAYGPQLFLSAPGRAEQDQQYDRHLLVLDPVASGRYAVQLLDLGSLGDYTELAALFFADADQDGQQELLALLKSDLREPATRRNPLGGRVGHYQTQVIRYRGPDRRGRPQYAPDPTPRPYLDGLATAAAVRQALAAHPRRPAPPRNPGAKAAE